MENAAVIITSVNTQTNTYTQNTFCPFARQMLLALFAATGGFAALQRSLRLIGRDVYWAAGTP